VRDSQLGQPLSILEAREGRDYRFPLRWCGQPENFTAEFLDEWKRSFEVIFLKIEFENKFLLVFFYKFKYSFISVISFVHY